jgi:hypothetical protein
LQQRRGLGSGRAPIGRPDKKLALDFGGQPLEGDQLTTKLFETVVVEPEDSLNPAIGELPSVTRRQRTSFRTCSKSTLPPPFAATFVLAPGRSLPRA